ncbi:hypothetical protein [Kingella potus]|nr:hypothetical protein [Kingella potus]UOP00042.1 hypothetical protein LVJ84_08540 [Kingella potus]
MPHTTQPSRRVCRLRRRTRFPDSWYKGRLKICLRIFRRPLFPLPLAGEG